MPKKRNCRRTEQESQNHDQAVKIRKMSDEQIVAYVENKATQARKAAYETGFREGKEKGVEEFICSLGVNKIVSSEVLDEITSFAAAQNK